MPNEINLSCKLHIGKLETRYTKAGDPVCSFSVAYNTGKKGEGKPPVWLNFVAFKENAERLSKLEKGAVVEIVEAAPKMDVWTDRDGVEQKRVVWTVWKLGGEDNPLPTDDSIPF